MTNGEGLQIASPDHLNNTTQDTDSELFPLDFPTPILVNTYLNSTNHESSTTLI